METEKSPYVLVIDDDESVAVTIEGILGKRAKWVKDGEQALKLKLEHTPHAVFVDIDLHNAIDGIQILPDLRRIVGKCPILVITGTAKEQNIMNALTNGADDFMTKPLSPEELTARVNIRVQDWNEKITKDVVLFGDLELNIPNRHLVGPNADVYVSPIAASIIAHLSQAGSKFVSKDNLKKYCWGDFKVTDNALHRKLHSVRQYLKTVSDTVQVQTKYGVGLRLESTAKVSRGTVTNISSVRRPA
jgi:DNA-binding response OmpR family regulator